MKRQLKSNLWKKKPTKLCSTKSQSLSGLFRIILQEFRPCALNQSHNTKPELHSYTEVRLHQNRIKIQYKVSYSSDCYRHLDLSFVSLFFVRSNPVFFSNLCIQNYNQIQHWPTNNLKAFIYPAAHSLPHHINLHVLFNAEIALNGTEKSFTSAGMHSYYSCSLQLNIQLLPQCSEQSHGRSSYLPW